ncbi:MAG: DNA protecting protein DprA [Bacteroidetes bacterium GWA2_30_7]|nr:MAG: DNA protecting protein DprA [Bacteroidetes bacterium GWA2_30_7]
MNELLKYKIAIDLIPGVGSINAKKLIAYAGSIDTVFSLKKAQLLKIPGIGESLANTIINNKPVIKRAEEEIQFLEKFNIQPYFYLDKDYPERLKNCIDSPIMLYSLGNIDFNTSKFISIVGTRKATDYGKQICKNIISELAKSFPDIVIVSGLAYGIDITAHKAALENNLKTIAVLGHGLDTVYPQSHKKYAISITKQGALLSEFMSNSKLDPSNFVRRNRIVAGISDATLVIESDIKGGALITAEIAGSYDRDVMAVPGKVGETYSRGSNFLIKSLRALLVENADDIANVMNWKKSSQSKSEEQKQLFVNLTPEEQPIFDLIRNNPNTNIDDLAYTLQLPIHKLSSILLNMEFSGYVKCLPGKVYILN